MKLYEQVQKQIKDAYSFIKDEYDSNLIEEFLYPNRVMEFYIPIKMDDWSTKVFTWYRSQHNNARWPYKGWIRFHQNVSKDEVMSLSAWMSLKTWAVWLPLWGGKWGIIVNPKELSIWELERLSRWYMQKLAPFIWNEIDVPAPDVNTTPQIMAWMLDEYIKVTWKHTPWVITGKPISIGWSQWRTEATALWGIFSLQQYLADKWQTIQWKKIVVQWAWNVGLIFGQLAHKLWASIVAISDSKWWIYNPNWLDITEITNLRENRGSVTDYQDWKVISNEELLLLECDVLVPAALENQITKDNASQLNTKLVLEMANWPTTYEADWILHSRGVDVIPDILANAGWVTVSYFEQVQNNTNYYWTEKEVNEKLEKIIKPATTHVVQLAQKYNTNLRNWAYISSIRKILEAMKIKG
jgi:glutamate dehydrogenase/leucine dehydrogenase